MATRDRVFSPLAPAGRFSRRCFALACGAGIAGFAIAANVGAGGDRAEPVGLLEPWTIPIVMLVFGAFAGLQFSLGDAAGKPARNLDEREHALRDRAYQSAYRTLQVIINFGAIWTVMQAGTDTWLPTGRGAFAIGYSVLIPDSGASDPGDGLGGPRVARPHARRGATRANPHCAPGGARGPDLPGVPAARPRARRRRGPPRRDLRRWRRSHVGRAQAQPLADVPHQAPNQRRRSSSQGNVGSGPCARGRLGRSGRTSGSPA